MAPKKKQSPQKVSEFLLDPSKPFLLRRDLLKGLAMDDSKEAMLAIEQLFEAAAAASAKDTLAKKIEEYGNLLQEMQSGPWRRGVFVAMAEGHGAQGVPRAHVCLQDGTSVYPVVPEETVREALQCGRLVYLDAQARAVLAPGPLVDHVGEEGQFHRRVGPNVEVLLRENEYHLFRSSQRLVEEIEAGNVEPGQRLLISPRQQFAFNAVPAEEGLSNFLFLDTSPLPDIDPHRDIGNPPRYLWELRDHVKTEMTNPEIRRKYRLRRTAMKFLTGPSGTGKTLSIEAFIRILYEVISEITGAPIEDLPCRVLRLRMSDVLSKWLGESDKRLSRFFDEAVQLHDEPFEAPDGRKWSLPVLAIGEEVDALSRLRGSDHDSVYDRIQTVALQRLDTTRTEFRDRVIIFLFSSNVMGLIDPAFIRRGGGTIEYFGRLTDRRAFRAVLSKLVRDLPLQDHEGADEQASRENAIEETVGWFYSENGNHTDQVTLDLASASEPMVVRSRDFLTGALVDRAVQQAATEACQLEERDGAVSGITADLLMDAVDEQVGSIVDLLTVGNVSQYIDLPSDAHVVNIHRVPQPFLQPYAFARRTG